MINRNLTDLYLDHFDSLSEAIYICWSNSFCDVSQTLDIEKLKVQIIAYGFYNHVNAIKKDLPHSFKNKLKTQSLLWVNKYLKVFNKYSLCEYIELYEQAIKEIETNLFLLPNKDDKIAYANVLIRDIDKNAIHNQCIVEAENHINYKEIFSRPLKSP